MVDKVQVWIFSGTQVLLLKTVADRGGAFQPVTGGVDPGEALATAALREAVEETGFEFSGPPIDVEHTVTFKTRFGNEATEHSFLLLLDQTREPRLDPREHTEFKWVSMGEAMALLPYPGQRDGLQKSAQKLATLTKKV